jgi:3-oxoacyl-[acyl-carrier-protein] synthase II
VPPAVLAQVPAASIPANVAAAFGFGGPNLLVPTACAAGNYAIARGLDWIRLGRADVLLAGGADPFSQIAFTGFHKLSSMAPDVPRPFSAGRAGMMVGEGAGVLVLETLEAARARGARIYAEVCGYGLSCDAHHMTAPHPEGAGARAAMTRALADAGVAPGDVGYVSAHGTGTEANDKAESLALRAVFGDDPPPMSSIKGALGHTMGAASALEAIATALAVHHGVLPPTANWLEADPACDVDCVPNAPREAALAVALSNGYAFGGNNAVIVLAKPDRA